MIVYFWKSPVGTFWIRQRPDGRWNLGIGDDVFGSYAKPEQAADDVYMNVTGCSEWDIRPPDTNTPTDLSEWEARRVNR